MGKLRNTILQYPSTHLYIFLSVNQSIYKLLSIYHPPISVLTPGLNWIVGSYWKDTSEIIKCVKLQVFKARSPSSFSLSRYLSLVYAYT